DQGLHGYHLQSASGRWNGETWVRDLVTSPCIDAGHPDSDYSKEPEDNGNRINIGRYGNTAYASLSGIAPITFPEESLEPVLSPEESSVFRVYESRLREASSDVVYQNSPF